jgi:Dolichyl-phosphate-mannose-protein mannosyltransferase
MLAVNRETARTRGLPPRSGVAVSSRPRRLGHGLAVAAIIAAGLGLRLPGVGRGLPYIHEWDEWFVVPPVIKMLLFHTMNPGIFIYGSVYYYLLLPVFYAHTLYLQAHGIIKSLDDVVLAHPLIPGYGWYINVPSFYLWARAFTALFGAATIYLTYRLGTATFGRAVGLLAAAVLAVAPGAVYYADTVRVDVPEAFFTTAALLAGLAVWRRGRPLDYLAAGLLAGIAVSTKQTALWLGAPLLLAHAYNERRRTFAGGSLALMAAGAVAGGLAGTPYLVVRPDLIRTGFTAHTETYGLLALPDPLAFLGRLGLNLAYLAVPLQGGDWYVVPHAGLGFLPMIAAIVGAAVAFRRHRRLQWYLAAFPIVQLLFLARANVFYTRNLAPVLPVAAIWAALGGVWLWQRLFADANAHGSIPRSLWSGAAAAGIIVLLGGPLVQSAALASWLDRHQDTRTQALEWLSGHVPRTATVAFELEEAWYLPDLDRVPFHVEWTDRHTPISWYAQHKIDYAAVSEWNDVNACPTVHLIPHPSYLPAVAQEAAFVPNSYPVIDPTLVIIRPRGSCPWVGSAGWPAASGPALLLAP